MPDATSTGLPLRSQVQASAAAAARFNVTSLQIGRRSASDGPSFGVAAWVLDLFGFAAGPLFVQTLFWTQIITICALVGFVLLWERRPLGSLGIRKASYADVEFGVGLLSFCWCWKSRWEPWFLSCERPWRLMPESTTNR